MYENIYFKQTIENIHANVYAITCIRYGITKMVFVFLISKYMDTVVI